MSAPEFLARLALRSRGLAERAAPSIAPLFASGPVGAIWERTDADHQVETELVAERAATVIDPSRPASVRSIQPPAAERPRGQAASPVRGQVPPIERGRLSVPLRAPEPTSEDVARSPVDARDQVQALVESILEQRRAGRIDHEQVDRPAPTGPAGTSPGPAVVLRRQRPVAEADAARAPSPPNLHHRPIAHPVPTPLPDRSRRSQPPVVSVTIGRLEVRAQPASTPARPPATRRPALGLDEYLKSRTRRAP